MTDELEERIKARGRRATRQRLVVARALAAARRAMSAQELHDQIRAAEPGIGLATVYRALEAQVEDGMASRLERDGHISAYVSCDVEHHHHLVCMRCQRVEDLSERLLKPMLAGVQREHDFQVDHAALDFYGHCARCRAQPGPKPDH